MDSDSDYDSGWIGSSSRNKRHRTRWPSYNAPASRGNSPNRHPEGPLPDLSNYGEGKQEKKKKRQGISWGESSSDDDYENAHYSDSDAAADESKEEAVKDSDSDAEGTKRPAPASDGEGKEEDDSDSDADGNKGEAHTDKEDSGKKKGKKKEEPEDDGSFEVKPLWPKKQKEEEESKEEVEMASAGANETSTAPPPPPPPATHSDRAEEFYKEYVAKHGNIDSSKALGALTSASHSKIKELYPGSHASSEEYSQFYRKVQQMGKDALNLHTNERLQQAEQQLATHGAHNATISIMLHELPTLKAFRDKSLEEQSHSYNADHVAFNDEWRRMLWNRLPKEDQTKEMYERVQTLADDVFREAVKVGQYRTSHRAYKPKRAEHTGYSDTEAEGQADEKPGNRNALKAFRGSLSAKKKKKPVREGLSRGSKDNDEVVSADEVEEKPKKPYRGPKTDNEYDSDGDAEVTKVRRGKPLRASTLRGSGGSVSSDDNMAKHLSRAEQEELDDSLDDEDFHDTVIGGSEEEKSDDNFKSLIDEFDDVKELGEQSRMYASSGGQSTAKDVRRRIMALERLDHILKADWNNAGGKPYTKISGVAFNSDNTFRKGAGKVPYLGANGLKHRIEVRLNQLRSLLPHSRSGTSTGQATPKKQGGPPVVTPPKAPKPTKRSAPRSVTKRKK